MKPVANTVWPRPGRPAGFTLVELMVALVIGSLIAVAGAALALSFDTARKATLAANNATGNGAAAMAALSSQLAMSGAGLISNRTQYCRQLYVAGAGAQSPLALDPVAIDHTNANGDVLQLAYATGGSATAQLGLSVVPNNPPSGVAVNPVGAVQANMQVLFAQDSANAAACTLRRVTSLTLGATLTTLNFDPTDPLNVVLPAPTPSYDTNSVLVPLGSLRVQRWFAQDGTLQQQDMLTGTASTVADGVLYLRAQYGIDDGTGLAWTNVNATLPSLTALQLQALRAVRVAVVARTADRERQPDPALCTTTVNPQVPVGNGWNLSVDVSALLNAQGTALVPDWRCYSYRSYTTVQPLRNVIWGTAS